MPPTMPTVTADVRPASQVMLTWKISTKTPPRSRKHTPAACSCRRATHHASRCALVHVTVPFSITKDKRSASRELKKSFSEVNSAGVTEPWSRLSSRNSSLAPDRKVEMQSANTRGVRQFTSSGKAGASRICPACRPIMTEPMLTRSAATSSTQPSFSLFHARAMATVQTRSVDCRSRCVPVGISCRPQFVRPYLNPKRRPTGATCRSLYRKCGPKSQEAPGSLRLPDRRWPRTFAAPRAVATRPSCMKAVAIG
mmetsp:Transcript_131246/g.408128  ORF Transcript_131246/g.408128 Transcript_131246/m.408128 type:complete len:254 (+) Transcript_131246:437-1198(+)